MKIFNGTPHAITIIEKVSCVYDSSIRKWVSPNPKILIEIPSNGALSATIITNDSGNIDNIPTFIKLVEDCDDYPDADIIICSVLYVSSCIQIGRDISKLYTVADTVYTTNGKTILGCLGISSAF